MAKHGVKAAIQYNLQEHACELIPGWEQENRQPAYHSFADAPDPVVKLERGSWTIAAAKFPYPFKAHSVTVLKMQER
jgi:hypothetical protein